MGRDGSRRGSAHPPGHPTRVFLARKAGSARSIVARCVFPCAFPQVTESASGRQRRQQLIKRSQSAESCCRPGFSCRKSAFFLPGSPPSQPNGQIHASVSRETSVRPGRTHAEGSTEHATNAPREAASPSRARNERKAPPARERAAGMPLARRRKRPPPQSARRGKRSSRQGWDLANHCDGAYPGGKGTTRRKDGGLTSRTVAPPRRRAAAARGRLAGTHRLAIVERTPRHRALPTRAHRRARAPRTTLGPTVTVALPTSIGTPSASTCEAGRTAKRRRRTRRSTRKPDREAPTHECFT